MVFPNSIICILVFVIFGHTTEPYHINIKESNLLSSNQPNVDTLHNFIKYGTSDKNLLERYSYFLINSNIDLEKELDFLKKSSNNFQTIYLSAIILKRQGKYTEMYRYLIPLLKLNPDFIPYYDDLIFAAQATDNIHKLKSSVTSNVLTDQYGKYVSAMLNYSEGNYTTALELLNKIVLQDSTNKYFLYSLSYTQRNLGNYEDALNLAEKALRYSAGDVYYFCKIYLAIGSLYYLSGKYKSAEDYYAKAYNLASKSNNKYDETVALVDLGIMLDQNGAVDNARENFNEAIDIANNYNFVGPKALAHSELGVSFTYTNELLNAKDNYNTSYSLYKKLGNKLRLSLLSDNLARLYMSQFNYREARMLYERGLIYAGGNKRAQAKNLVGLADVYANLSNYARALEYYKKANEISSEIKDISLEAEISTGIGALNFNLNNFKGALRNYGRANELSALSGDQYMLADTYHKLGLTYLQLNNIGKAEDNLNTAVNLSKKYSDVYTQAISSIDLAYLMGEKKQFPKAFKLLNESKEITTKYDLRYLSALAYLIEGKIFEKNGDVINARRKYNNAIKLLKNLNEPNIKIELLNSLASLFEKDKNYLESKNAYKKAIKIIDRISWALYSKDDIQIAYFSGKNEIYNSYAKLLLNEGKNREAYLVIDRSRSRNTSQNLFNLKLESEIKDDNILNKLYDYEWLINSGLYDQARVDSVKRIYNNILLTFSSKHPGHKSIYRDVVAPKSIEGLQKKLSDNEYVFSFFSSNDKMHLFQISDDDFKSIEVNLSKPQLLKMISDISPYYNADNNSGRIFYNQDLFSFNVRASYGLFKKLLYPALKNIPHNSKIIFSLTPELVTIPFEFLVTKDPGLGSSYNYSNKSFLVDDYQVSYTPSVELYINEKENYLKNDGRTLIVGNPSINNHLTGLSERRGLLEESAGLPEDIALFPLKYSEDEVNEIGSLLRADKILVEGDATETNFKKYADHSKIIHLSTHSILLNKQPVIFLSNLSDPVNDGFLESSEIVQLKLNSDLIVLSSCNSGLGKIDESEGIVGMTKAFYEAGAKSVMVSLWQVNDKYTSILMTLFYKNLRNGMNKSEALRQAKIQFIKEYSPNPFYWSAFILSGDTSTIELNDRLQINTIILAISGIILLAIMIVMTKAGKRKIRI